MPTATPGGAASLLNSSNLSLPSLRKPAIKQSSPLSQHAAAAAMSPGQLPQAKAMASSASLPIPRQKPSSAGDDLTRFQDLRCEDLVDILKHDTAKSERTLVIDIRPSSSFASRRIKGSINICAPSTLLKRAGVTIQRVEDAMLQCDSDRKKFEQWKQGPMKSLSGDTEAIKDESNSRGLDRVVVLDTDTSKVDEAGRPSVGGGGPCLVGMLRKFDAAGYAGDLCWLVGGFSKFAAVANDNSDLVETGPASDVSASTDHTRGTRSALLVQQQADEQFSGPSPPQQSDTHSATFPGASSQARSDHRARSRSQLGGLPMEAFTDTSTTQRSSSQSSHPAPRVGDGGSGKLSNTAACNPFFDNIRQCRELQHGITERIPLNLPELTPARKAVVPEFVLRLASLDDKERAEQLAQNFFEVEKAEQSRLMATMRQHASESTYDPRSSSKSNASDVFAPSKSSPSAPHHPNSGSGSSGDEEAMQLSSAYCRISGAAPLTSLSSSAFPFSIAAAIEKGSDNRYNNIWTYEHSRVRIDSGSGVASDYLNGSYVEPMKEFGCYRQYVATQAPLPATFDAFWATVWQENVRTIAMLTREYESGRIQSHNYWDQKHYGPNVSVDIVSTEQLNGHGNAVQPSDESQPNGSESEGNTAGGGGFFASVSAAKSQTAKESRSAGDVVMIRRKIMLRNSSAPEEAPRLVTHLQYVGWPDYSIPEDPNAMLIFRDIASQAQQDAHVALREEMNRSVRGTPDWTKESAVGPLMLHCSAGVGRTGTYIVIDTVLDVLRRERRRQRGLPPLDLWDNGAATRSGSVLDVNAISPTNDVEMVMADSQSAKPTQSADGVAPTPQTPERFGSSSNGGSIAWPPRLDLEGTPFFAGVESSLRGPRRSLKRELSPSAAMDVDQRPSSAGILEGGTNETTTASASLSSGRRGSAVSFPPIRRNRSPSSDVLQNGGENGGSSSSSSSTSSLAGTNVTAGADHQGQGWGKFGIRQPDGMDTPSRAMDGMNLGFGGPGGATPTSSSSRAATPNASTVVSPRRKASVRSRRPTVHSSGAGGTTAAGHTFSNLNSGSQGSGNHPNATDLVRHATDVAREQRMSSVQTQRQYVFCYLAVTHGVLREARAEGIPGV